MHKSGQNLIEYGIIISLVVVVSVGGLVLFGQNMSQTMGDTLGVGDGRAGGLTTLSTGTTPTGNIPPATGGAGPFPNLPGDIVTVDLGNGKSLTLNMANSTAVAEALGPLGTTDNALAAIRQIIEQLQAQNADPSTISALERLANKAHDIRQVQDAIKNVMPDHAIGSNVEWANFASGIPIRMPNGETKTLQDATTLLGGQNGLNFALQQQHLESGYSTYERWTQAEIDNSPLLTFMSTLQDVNRTPEIQNSPALRALLNDVLSAQIYNASGATFNVTYNGGDLTGYINTVRQNANNICTMGQGTTCQDRPG